MVVETFEVEEVASQETNQEHLNLLKELGLDSQLELSNNSDKPFPFREMKRDEQYIYGILCSSVYTVEKYQRSTIPYRVLAIYKLALDYGFTKFEIWDTEEQAIKDPVLVAYKGDTKYILARWGEHLDSLEVLSKEALKVANQKLKSNLKKIMNTCKTILDQGLTDLSQIPINYYGRPTLDINYLSDLDRLV